ncbi:MAG: PorV/PorQ family protein [Bacteroidales bacterium]|nr:PorV/PorQ family protein [Bacteroidales bacterium]
MSKKIVLFVAAWAVSVVAAAQSVSFLNIPSDARSAAMAHADISLQAGAFAVDNNIASAAFDYQTAAVGVNYFSWAPSGSGMGIINAGGYYRLGKLAIGLSGRICNEKPYDVISSVSKVISTYQPREIALGAGFSYRIIAPLSVGVTLRYVSSNLAEQAQGSAFAADINAMFVSGGLSVALGVTNLGTQISYGGTNKYSLPAMARAGASYQIAGLTASAEIDYMFSGALMAGLGVEYCIADIAFVRGGFHYGDPSKAIPSYASLGAGFKWAGFHVDLCFLMASATLVNTLSLGLGYIF